MDREDSFDGGCSPIGSWRPRAGGGPHEIVALKRPFATCDMLKRKSMEPRRSARSAHMPLDLFFVVIRRVRLLNIWREVLMRVSPILVFVFGLCWYNYVVA